MTPFYDKDGITIYCGDCAKVMGDVIEDNTIDLTVTSPPYDDMDLDYNPIPKSGLRDYNGYEWDFKAIAEQLWRVSAKGGVVVWVVNDPTIDGSESLASSLQKIYFRGLGFNIHDTMIYEVAGTGAKGSNLAYWQGFEFMLVLSKESPKAVNRIADVKNSEGGRLRRIGQKADIIGSRTSRRVRGPEWSIRPNVWRYTSAGNDVTNHPAPFPEALARDHIISWSNAGDIILDPMAGSGTTLKMAQALGRRAIGIDISEDYCKIMVERLRQLSFFSLPAMKSKPKAQQLELVG